MHILILGGTAFVGRALATEALRRGHKVTLFNRGTKPPVEGTTTIIGDRLSGDGLEPLEGLAFDAVIDTWSAEPEPAIRAMEVLRGRMGHYTFISTLSVYDSKVIEPPGEELNDESADLYDVDAPGANKLAYQFNKRSVEIAAERVLKDTPCLIARPGVILGPFEAEHIERGRLLWWLHRLHRGGPTLAPGPEGMSLQLVDVRDLAHFVIVGAETQLTGPHNIISDVGDISMGQLLKVGMDVTGSKADLVWKTPEEISKTNIIPFMELPLWLNPTTSTYASVYRWDTSKAKAAGLKCRPIEDTVRDTWQWMQGADGPVLAPEGSDSKRGGLSREKEDIALSMT